MPEDIEIEAVDGLEPFAALATAAVSLSGMLDDSTSDTDLEDAADHFRTLLGAGVFDLEAWNNEAHEIIRQVIEWGDREGIQT